MNAPPPPRLTLKFSRSPDRRQPPMRRLGGVVVSPRKTPAILEVAIIETGAVAEDMIDSWEIGDGLSVALLAVKEMSRSARPTLRLFS